MTVEKAITLASDIKPHAFSEATLIQWLNEAEGHIMTEVLRVHPEAARRYEAETDSTKILTVPPPFDKLYPAYLTAMIDFANGEYDKFQNSREIYNAAVDEYAKWYIRTHESITEIFNNYIRLYDYINTGKSKAEWIPEGNKVRQIGIYSVGDWKQIDTTETFCAELIIADNLVRDMDIAAGTGDFRLAKSGDDIFDVRKWMMYTSLDRTYEDVIAIDHHYYRQVFITDKGDVYTRYIYRKDGVSRWGYIRFGKEPGPEDVFPLDDSGGPEPDIPDQPDPGILDPGW